MANETNSILLSNNISGDLFILNLVCVDDGSFLTIRYLKLLVHPNVGIHL